MQSLKIPVEKKYRLLSLSMVSPHVPKLGLAGLKVQLGPSTSSA